MTTTYFQSRKTETQGLQGPSGHVSPHVTSACANGSVAVFYIRRTRLVCVLCEGVAEELQCADLRIIGRVCP